MQPVSRRRLVVALVIAAVVAMAAAALAQLGSNRREAGGSGWDTDSTGQPDYVVLRVTDPLLPHGYAVGVNTVLYSLTL